MRRSWRYRRMLWHTLLLVGIPFLLVGTGYALYSQELSIQANVAKPAYSYSNNLLLTYTTSKQVSGSSTQYTITVTIKNNGTAPTESWQAAYDLPADRTTVECSSVVSCTLSGSRLTTVNSSTNGQIDPGATMQYQIQFTTANPSYVLQNVSVTGQTLVIYRDINGLTVQVQRGGRQGGGNTGFYWPFTFTVRNNSGQTVTNWRITMDWDPSRGNNMIVSMPSSVDYVESPTMLTIQSKSGLSNNATATFVAELGARKGNWNPTNLVIVGAP